MSERASFVAAQLQKRSIGATVTYEYAPEGRMYSFCVKYSTVSHWLYLTQKFIEENDKTIIINLLWTAYNVSDTFNNAKETKRLFYDDGQLREVGDDFLGT